MCVPKPQQLTIQALHRRLPGGGQFGPGRLEGLACVWIGNPFAFMRIGKGAEGGKFITSSFTHQFRQFTVVTGEKQEGLFGGEFVAHEHQRDHR
ncbi:hypothetical protein D3C87_1670850 [compost metagenome]